MHRLASSSSSSGTSILCSGKLGCKNSNHFHPRSSTGSLSSSAPSPATSNSSPQTSGSGSSLCSPLSHFAAIVGSNNGNNGSSSNNSGNGTQNGSLNFVEQTTTTTTTTKIGQLQGEQTMTRQSPPPPLYHHHPTLSSPLNKTFKQDPFAEMLFTGTFLFAPFQSHLCKHF